MRERGSTMAYEWIVDALEQTWSSINRKRRPRDPEAYDAPTPCPGWSVRDVLSHLLGFELMIRGEMKPPTHEGPWPAHVRNPIGEINESIVESYRSLPGSEVLDLFRATTNRSLEHLRSLDDEAWEKVGWSPEG